MKAKRLLKNIRVQFISLVDRPANRKKIIAKSEDFSEEDAVFSKEVRIEKIDEEKRVVYGIVYAPNEVDAHGDTTTPEEIEKAMEWFMKEGRTRYVDKNHDYQPDEGFVRESWLVKEGDPLFKEVGAWAVGIKIESDETWQQIKKGEIAGLSFAGWAEAEPIEKAKEPRWVVQPFQNLPFADPETPWSFTAEDADEIIEKYGWEGMKKAHLVVDESDGPVPERKNAYKFPIAKIVDGRLKIVPRAIFAASAYLSGARGVQVSLPEEVKEKLRKLLARYYHAMDRKAPWEKAEGFFTKLARFLGLKDEEVEEVNEVLERLESLEKAYKQAEQRLADLEVRLGEALKKAEEGKEEVEKAAKVEELVEKIQEELKKHEEDIKLLKGVIASKAQEVEKTSKDSSVFKGLIL